MILLSFVSGSFSADLICLAVDPLAPARVIAKMDATLEGDIRMFSCVPTSPATV